MIIVCVLLGILCVILITMLLLYRRQIRAICRQLCVHRTEESHTEIWLDLPNRPFRELQGELNQIIQYNRERQAEYRRLEQSWREFVANVSHDIRTPVTAISGYFQMLAATDDNAKKAEYLNILLGRIMSFQELLDDFFLYASTTSGDRKMEMERCDMTRILSENLFLYQHEIEEIFGIPELSIPEEELFVSANVSALNRIFQNIIKNALCHGQGKLQVTLQSCGEEAQITISNGYLGEVFTEPERVFERTYKADSNRTRQTTGLGLSIVKELVESMEGRVTAFATEDKQFGIIISLRKVK